MHFDALHHHHPVGEVSSEVEAFVSRDISLFSINERLALLLELARARTKCLLSQPELHISARTVEQPLSNFISSNMDYGYFLDQKSAYDKAMEARKVSRHDFTSTFPFSTSSRDSCGHCSYTRALC